MRQAWRRGRWPTCRSRRWPTRRRSTTGRMSSRRSCRRSTRADVEPPVGIDAGAAEADRAARTSARARWVWEQYDHVDRRQHRAAARAATPPWCGVRRPEGRWRSPPTCTPRYCAGRSRTRAASRRWPRPGATSPRSARRPLAHHRQPQFRQSGEARDHGPVRRRHRGHRRGLPRARLPGRVRQRLALQRDQRPRHPADAGDRRRRPARRCRPSRATHRRSSAAGDADPADRRDAAAGSASRSICARSAGREEGAPPPVDLAAENAATAISCAA